MTGLHPTPLPLPLAESLRLINPEAADWRKDMEAFSKWLASLDYYWILLGAVVIMAALFFVFRAIPKTRPVTGQLITLSGMCVLSLLFYILTFSLRVSKMSASTGFTARTMPRLWCALMVPIAIAAFVEIIRHGSKDEPFGRWGLALGVALASIFSVLMFKFLGYYISSALFIVGVMLVMNERRWKMLVITPAAWIVFTYFVFQKMLYIGLPSGMLFDLIF